MFPQNFYTILNYDCNVNVLSNGMAGEHVKNIWSIKIVMSEDGRILLPFEEYSVVEKNLLINHSVKVTARTCKGVKENHYMPLGFLMKGNASFLSEGPEYDSVKALYPWSSKVMEISITGCKELLSI